MNLAAGTNVPDGTSGFRAYSRDAALQLNLIAKYSFATETTIQAGNKGQAIAFIKLRPTPKPANLASLLPRGSTSENPALQ